MAKRAFISFQMEDEYARNLLSSQARDQRNDLEFVDYSVKEPWDNSWKTECKRRISLTSGTIVLVGKTTYQSDAVAWEIAETRRQGLNLFGIWIHPDLRPKLPAGLSPAEVAPWNIAKIVNRISAW